MEKYQKGDIDFLVGYDIVYDKCYIFAEKEIEHINYFVSASQNSM